VAGTAALISALVTTAAPPSAGAAPAAGYVTNPAALVNTFIGTGSGGQTVGQVDTFPGASAPFGMVQWSPDTPSRPPGGGYNYADSAITGFSLTHLSGPGCAVAGDFPILPAVGALPSDPGSVQAPFSHSEESAAPGAYSVTLSPGTSSAIHVSLGASLRTGLGSFTFPRTRRAHLVFKVADSAAGGGAATFHVVNNREVTGSVTSGHFCGQPDTYTVYFAARLQQPFTHMSTWGSGGDGTVAGAVLSFNTVHHPTITMRTAVSYVSAAGAEANLASGPQTWSVPTVAADTFNTWNGQLRKIDIGGGTHAEQVTFYTALYHALLDPTVFNDADGQYPGFDGKVHTVPAGHAQYSNFSGWDVYRDEIPLLAMLEPAQASDMATSLINDEQQGGWLPKWPVANGYTGVMNGDSADPMLADFYAFGAHGFNVRNAVAAMVHGATGSGAPGEGYYVERPHGSAFRVRGYVPNVTSDSISPVPNGASETLEYSIDDFAISRLAGAAGEPRRASTFLSGSQNWANVFNTSTGYIQPRNAQGAFPSGNPNKAGMANFGQSGFQEGDAAQYSWMVPQDLKALFRGMGGDAQVVARLNKYFTRLNAGPNAPYQWQGNEPALDTPFAYDSAGAPYRTQEVVRRVENTLYSDSPGGEPGNDDLGAMSSWYVWAALGLYPQTPGVPMLVLDSPLFPEAVVTAPHQTLVIEAPGASAARPYIQSLEVNGRPTSKTYVDLAGHDLLMRYTLGSTPNSTWGTAAADGPPSFPAGPVQFPPSTRATLSVRPSAVRVAPGSSTSVTVRLSNPSSDPTTTITYRATSSSGLTATPHQGTVKLLPGSTSSRAITVSAASNATPGYYAVTVSAQTSTGAVIPSVSVLATVAKPGTAIPTAYVTNYSDNTVTPIALSTRSAGPVIAVGSGPDGAVITPDGKLLFVADNNSNDVTVIDTATNRVVKKVAVGSVAADVAVTPDGKTVWVTNYGSGTAQPIDVATLTAGAPVSVGSQPERLAITPSGNQAWVADQGSGTVSVVDTATSQVVATIAVGAEPFGVAISPDGADAFISNGGSDTVSVISTATDKVVDTIAVGTGADPQGMAVSPDGKWLYVTEGGAGGVTPVNLANDSPGPLVPTGGLAYAVSFTPDGSTAYVVDTNANNVVPVTVSTATAGTGITVGNAPDGIAISPAAGT
jgi:predicted alpha-1,2-mannosidase